MREHTPRYIFHNQAVKPMGVQAIISKAPGAETENLQSPNIADCDGFACGAHKFTPHADNVCCGAGDLLPRSLPGTTVLHCCSRTSLGRDA